MGLPWPSQVSSPVQFPADWDSITINGLPWGVSAPGGIGGGIRVRGAKRSYKIDQKDAKGQDGATQTYVGSHPKSFKLEFRIWTTPQWLYWNSQILPLFYYSGVIGKVFPILIYHPATAVVGIASVLTDDIGQPDVDERTKEVVQVIEVREYFPAAPGNASVTPVGPSGPPLSPAGFAARSQVIALTAINQHLAAEVSAGPNLWKETE